MSIVQYEHSFIKGENEKNGVVSGKCSWVRHSDGFGTGARLRDGVAGRGTGALTVYKETGFQGLWVLYVYLRV